MRAFRKACHRASITGAMSTDRLGIFKVPNSEGKFIVEIRCEEIVSGEPLHTSRDLAADEAKNLLRHYNIPDNEIDTRLASATPHGIAAVAGSSAS